MGGTSGIFIHQEWLAAEWFIKTGFDRQSLRREIIVTLAHLCSGLNPQQTFLNLIDESLLPRDWITKARNFQFNLIAPLFAF